MEKKWIQNEWCNTFTIQSTIWKRLFQRNPEACTASKVSGRQSKIKRLIYAAS